MLVLHEFCLFCRFLLSSHSAFCCIALFYFIEVDYHLTVDYLLTYRFNRWLLLKNCRRWLRLMCVKGTWIPSWSDIILIWYHYILMCTLKTIFNWWLSNKDMKLQVLIKETLVAFQWPTFCIILLRLLGIEHFFLAQETNEVLLYSPLFVEHTTQDHWRNVETTNR